MIDRALDFIDKHGEVIKDQTEYLNSESYSWAIKDLRKHREDEHRIHTQILNSLVDKLEYIVNEAGSEISKNKKIQNFTKKIVESVEHYSDIASKYFISERWQEYEGEEAGDNKSAELAFQDKILKNIISFKNKIVSLKLDDEDKDLKIRVYANAIIPIPMREEMEERYPEIAEFLNKK